MFQSSSRLGVLSQDGQYLCCLDIVQTAQSFQHPHPQATLPSEICHQAQNWTVDEGLHVAVPKSLVEELSVANFVQELVQKRVVALHQECVEELSQECCEDSLRECVGELDQESAQDYRERSDQDLL
jgi:hypothetical protein